jgi:hypothetical protein
MLAPYPPPPARGKHVLKVWPSYYPVVNQVSYDPTEIPDQGWAPHLRIGVFALLLTLAAGFAILLGWVWIGGFGIVLGLIVDVAGIAWVNRRYGAVFPPDAEPGLLLRVLAAVIVLGGIAALINYT